MSLGPIENLLREVRTATAGTNDIVLGIIGGTGIYQNSDVIKHAKHVKINETPFGKPSDEQALTGKISKTDVVLISRHGVNHSVNPTDVNYRANLWALKHQFGCHAVIATTACGSLKPEIEPLHIVVLDQYIDRTKTRKSSFYKVSHVPQGDPFDKSLRDALIKGARDAQVNFHPSGTAVTIEGPRFSTKAESRLYQCWGASIVNMTTFPEIVLATELGLHYAALALVSDYDCWHDDPNEQVCVSLVEDRMRILRASAFNVIAAAVLHIEKVDWQIEHTRMLRISGSCVMNGQLDV